MKGTKTIFLGGAHRGGQAITNEALRLLPGPDTYSEVVIADPKGERAVELANVWKEHGVIAEARKEACEKAIGEVVADAVLLSIDAVAPMAKVLEKSPLPAQWQLLCRGLGENGPVIGMSGSVHEGKSEERIASTRLIKELGSFIMPRSSSAIRQNPLNADFLYVMRQRVSTHSAHRLPILDREPKDLPGGPLNLFWGPLHYPLMVRERPAKGGWRELKEQALSADLPVYLKNVSRYAVATVGKKIVDFFVLEESRGRRIISFHMPLVHALPMPARSSAKMASGEVAAGAALGLGLLGLASALASAAVTD